MAGSGNRTQGSSRSAGGTVNPSLRERVRRDQPLRVLTAQYRGLRRATNAARSALGRAQAALEADRFNPTKRAAYSQAQVRLNRAFTAAEPVRSERMRRFRSIQRDWMSQNETPRPRPATEGYDPWAYRPGSGTFRRADWRSS